MTIVEIRRGEYVDPEPVEHEPGCVRFESDPGPAFENFLLPRLESVRDEASREILAAVRAGRPFGDAVLDVLESLPAHKTKKLRAWIEEARTTRIYAYVDVHGTSRLSYGLLMTTGGPRDAVIASKEMRTLELENVAPYWQFYDAIKEMRRSAGSSLGPAFVENPLVEVSDEDEYDEALAMLNMSPERGVWDKPGLYNFEESPPTYSGTVEDYEHESMKYEAEQALEYMFQGDEWKEICESLLEKS